MIFLAVFHFALAAFFALSALTGGVEIGSHDSPLLGLALAACFFYTGMILWGHS